MALSTSWTAQDMLLDTYVVLLEPPQILSYFSAVTFVIMREYSGLRNICRFLTQYHHILADPKKGLRYALGAHGKNSRHPEEDSKLMRFLTQRLD